MERQPGPNAADSKRGSKVPQATGQGCQKSSTAWARVLSGGGLRGSHAVGQLFMVTVYALTH